MKDLGWIALHRKILDNPVVCKDGDHFAVWMYLLLKATHKDYDVMFGKERITLNPGQQITSGVSISQRLMISESKVRRILKLFKSDGQIDEQSTRYGRLITIVNWSKYQDRDEQSDEQVTNERRTSDEQVTTNNNITIQQHNKKEKKSMPIDADLFDRFWEAYPKKLARKKAQESWGKLKPDPVLTGEIIAGVKAWAQSLQWMENGGKYIPYPSTFLNQERWKETPQAAGSVEGLKHLRAIPDYNTEPDSIEKMRMMRQQEGERRD